MDASIEAAVSITFRRYTFLSIANADPRRYRVA